MVARKRRSDVPPSAGYLQQVLSDLREFHADRVVAPTASPAAAALLERVQADLDSLLPPGFADLPFADPGETP
ncbi:MAG: hypothetical protein FJX76_26055 [Armatimonadetes bacterium]|nr:hypothetical protein [Armatimonadota bacterium]